MLAMHEDSVKDFEEISKRDAKVWRGISYGASAGASKHQALSFSGLLSGL
jgi:hypothetical protein